MKLDKGLDHLIYYRSLADYERWTRAMRTLCCAMHRSQGDNVSATSLTIPLKKRPGEIRLLRNIAMHLGEEYGLQGAFSVEDGAFTVRYERKCPTPTHQETV